MLLQPLIKTIAASTSITDLPLCSHCEPSFSLESSDPCMVEQHDLVSGSADSYALGVLIASIYTGSMYHRPTNGYKVYLGLTIPDYYSSCLRTKPAGTIPQDRVFLKFFFSYTTISATMGCFELSPKPPTRGRIVSKGSSTALKGLTTNVSLITTACYSSG